ncbi:MAG: flavodoxin family protein [Nanoarchaeota archaeon]|nr:flavodoxin family protein [Nanoarchaeota archaeon]
MKSILIISGSPRAGQNSEQIAKFCADVALKRNFNTDVVIVHDMVISPCISCDGCKKKGVCVKMDGMQSIYPKMEKADAIIVCSPVYMGSVSAQVKIMMDRSVSLRRNGFKLKNKICAGVAIGGSRNGGQELAMQVIHAWAHIHGMIIVGDNSHFGGICQAPFEKDEVGKKTVEDCINKVCDVLSLLK